MTFFEVVNPEALGQPRGWKVAAFRSVLVLTGSTLREDLKSYPFAPTVVAESIAELAPEYALAVGADALAHGCTG
ncbi:MAG: HAD hydrolase-like protein, partial [Ilumatobacteraceae bacterium]